MHPKVREIYERVGLEIPINPDDIIENEFFSSIIEGSEKVRIDHIFRVVGGGGSGSGGKQKSEYILYNSTLIGENANGSRRYLTKHHQGTFEKPIFQQIYNAATGQAQPLAKIDRSETVYEIPYSPSAVQAIFEKDEFDSEIGMTLDLNHIQYTVRSRDDFINLSTDELMKKIEMYY